MSIRRLKWILLVPVLALLLLAQGFCAESPVPPSGQPEQMWSKVDYDPKLTDPFFESNKWSYPWYIIKHPDGHFEDTSTGIPPEKEPPRLKHTARCFSDSHGEKHLVNFCEAKLLDRNMIDLAIHDDDPAFFDHLRVRIRNGMFTCQFRTASKILLRIPPDIVSETKRQKLTLEKKVYQKGDVIKGRIDFQSVEEPTNPGYIEQWGRSKTTVKVYGVFKTIVE